MSARSKIVDALIVKLKTIAGTDIYSANLYGNVIKDNKFWDEIVDFPYVCAIAGTETREYLPGAFKWGFLNITLRIYVKGETPIEQLESVMADIEKCIDANRLLVYDLNKSTTEININSITTDEGLLAPFGVGEIILAVQYQVI